jgi:hypothetical protein
VNDPEDQAMAHGTRKFRSKKAVSKDASFDAQYFQVHFLFKLQIAVVCLEGRGLLGVDLVDEETDCQSLRLIDSTPG